MGLFLDSGLRKLLHPYYLTNILLSLSFLICKMTYPLCSWAFDACELNYVSVWCVAKHAVLCRSKSVDRFSSGRESCLYFCRENPKSCYSLGSSSCSVPGNRVREMRIAFFLTRESGYRSRQSTAVHLNCMHVCKIGKPYPLLVFGSRLRTSLCGCCTPPLTTSP